MGSNSLTRDRNQAPCIGSMESYPLDRQGSPHLVILVKHESIVLLTSLKISGPHIFQAIEKREHTIFLFLFSLKDQRNSSKVKCMPFLLKSRCPFPPFSFRKSQKPTALSFNNPSRASLVAQWLRIHLPMQGTRVRALVQEDPPCRGATGPMRHSY